MAVLSNSKKINTKYWTVFAVEPFKKKCDNFDAEFKHVLSNFSFELLKHSFHKFMVTGNIACIYKK